MIRDAATIGFSFLLLLSTPALAAPHISYIYPAGGQRGTTVKVAVNGSELGGLTGFFSTGTGLSGKIIAGKDAGNREIEIAIAKDAPLGIQQIRLCDPSGLSNARYFAVGQYPETAEKEPNDTLAEALKVSPPVTINGRIEKYTDIDAATFHAKATETIVCEIHALRILGEVGDSWLKGYMEVQDSEGRTLASSEGTSDDYYRWDPLIAFTPPKEGDYTVFYRDLNWRGAPMAVYRLTIGAIPHAVAIFPLGGGRGTQQVVRFTGPNLKDAEEKLSVPTAREDEIELAFTTPAGTTNARPFQLSDLPDAMQSGPNHTRESAQSVAFPCVVNGRLQDAGARDYYKFKLDKPQHVVLEVYSRRLGTPLDSELVLYGADGKILQTNDDARERDSRIERDLAPGEYTVMVHDMDDRGGPAFPYRLFIAPPQPRLRVLAAPDAPKLARGGKVTLKVHVDREDGVAGDVLVTVSDLPNGVTATPLTISKDKQDGELTLTATADAALGPARLKVMGAGKAGDRAVEALARTEETYNIQGTAYQRALLGPILFVAEK